jgi:hypothetical protein
MIIRSIVEAARGLDNAPVNPPVLSPVGLNRLLAYSNLFLAGRSS